MSPRELLARRLEGIFHELAEAAAERTQAQRRIGRARIKIQELETQAAELTDRIKDIPVHQTSGA